MRLNNNNNNCIQRCNLRLFTISSLRRELSPTRTLKWPRRNCVQITCNTSSAYHVQHVVLPATWYKGADQLLSLTELKSHKHLSFILLAEPLNWWRRGGNRSTQKNSGDELQKMPHTKARRFKPQARLEPALQHRQQARKADMLTITPHVRLFS